MSAAEPAFEPFRDQLLDRREQLESALRRSGGATELQELLVQVDAALARLSGGTFGICEECHEPIESDRIAADPLLRLCLDHLTDPQRREFERDLERAASIQRALLPPSDLAFPGWRVAYSYRPSGMVSGDFCDVIPPRSDREPFHFFVGDVSGKGVSASILMSHLQAIFRGLAGGGESLSESMSAAGRLLCESTLPSHYATVIGGRASTSGEIELCNAGHVPGVLVGPGGVQTLPPGGLPLGMFCETSYASHRVQLAPGDALLLYTDGLTDAAGAQNEPYGVDRVVSRLRDLRGGSADELIRASIDGVTAFRAGAARLDDDLTLLAVRRE